MSAPGIRWGLKREINYVIRRRSRMQWETTVHGKAGNHRRRVARWSPWKSIQYVTSAIKAAELYDLYKVGIDDIGVFLSGRRLTIEQLRRRASDERAEIDRRLYSTGD